MQSRSTWEFTRFCLLVGLFCGSMAAHADTVLWGSSSDGLNPGSIFRIDAATGAATLVGPGGLGDKISALAVDPQTGTLYGILGSTCKGATLITVDQDTGAATSIGIIKGAGFDGTPGGHCPAGADALTFGNDGTLYAGGWNGGTPGGKLLTLDKSTGQVLANKATDVVNGEHKPAHIAGLATAPDGTLWVSHGNIPGILHTIDPATGHFTSSLELSDCDAIVDGLEFGADETLYGSSYEGAKLVTIETSGRHPGMIAVVGHFGYGVKISGLALLGSQVAATECTAEQGGCNPTGGQTLQLPQNFVVPVGATITQKLLRITDPRVASGRCGRDPLVLFADDPQIDDLIIPEYLCGSPDFVILKTESDLEFDQGTLITTNQPEAFFDNALSCDSPIVGNPQQQDVMVWQPTDSADIEEGHALELTFECGSSRGRTKGLSWYVVGMHIDFGLDWDTEPQAVRQAFIDLTDVKLHGLVRAIVNAKRVLPRKDFNKLLVHAAVAHLLHKIGLYQLASREMSVVIHLHGRADFEPSELNHSGNVEMRAHNVKFMLDEKVIGIMN
ncbi:MAG: DUF6923 family protein [Woeseiaceae bacterium]